VELSANKGSRCRFWLTAFVVAAFAIAPGLARADGDPASDVLLGQDAFVPSDSGFSGQQQAELARLLRAAAHAGAPIRLAVIPSEYDLGSVGALGRRPRIYVHFLGIELSNVYRGRYRIGVKVTTKHVAGATLHLITHDEVAFVIDVRGFVRALFGWPYGPADVDRELKAL